MTSVTIEVPGAALLQAVEQLDRSALNEFVDQVLLLKARRTAPSLDADSAELLQQINQLGLNHAERSRLHDLLHRSEAGLLTAAENAEQQQLTEQSEQLNAQRMQLLIQLAMLWQQPLESVMQQLGLLNQRD